MPAEIFVDNVSWTGFDNREEYYIPAVAAKMDFLRIKAVRSLPAVLRKRGGNAGGEVFRAQRGSIACTV